MSALDTSALAQRYPHVPFFEIEQAAARLAIVRQLENGGSTYAEVAAEQGVPISTLNSWVRTHERMGFLGLVSRSHRSKPLVRTPKSTQVRDRIEELVHELPIRYTGARRLKKWLAREGTDVSLSTINYHLTRLGLATREQREKARNRRNRAKPQRWRD